MASDNMRQLESQERQPYSCRRWFFPLLAVGLVLVGGSYLLTGEPRRFWLAYVTNVAFWLSLSLGGLFFVLIQHATRSGWSVVVRRIAELLAANMPTLAFLLAPVVLVTMNGNGVIYPWAVDDGGIHSEHPAATTTADEQGQQAHTESDKESDGSASSAHGPGLDELTLKKRPYLNFPFFLFRWHIYFAVWIGLSRYLWKRSVWQDESGDARWTLRMQRISGIGLVLYGLTVTFAAFDLLMSLDPHWFSTIFGVYYFSGAVVGVLAIMILILLGLQRGGMLASAVSVEHYHDLGKLLFAFVFFWGYIAFSQYMLIWYGNIPEETGWLVRRGLSTSDPNAWTGVALILAVGHFAIPFAGLLSRHVKRQRTALAFWAVWMLIMHWVDIWWLVMPELSVDRLPLGIAEIGTMLGLGALYFAGLARRADGRALIPKKDPRLPESLAFHNS